MKLKISDNGHYLTREDGQPFFWLGDTAWMLAARTTREEALRYLDDRKSKQFNVIQLVAFNMLGIDVPNAYGEIPFIDNDISQPNDRYFEHLDFVVDAAKERSMVAVILPCWGSMVRPGAGCIRSNTEGVLSDPANLRTYCTRLAARYADCEHVIWALGGDIDPDGLVDLWREAAAGLKDGGSGDQLITYHPDWARNAGSSSIFLHDEDWLDFNMIQSSHVLQEHNYTLVYQDWHRKPPKPTLDSEPPYENIRIDLKSDAPVFTADQIRRYHYLGVFAGGLGTTYGCVDVCIFWEEGRPRRPFAQHIDWRDALNLPGAGQMQHMKKLMESRPTESRIPDQSLLCGHVGAEDSRLQALRDADGRWIMVYATRVQPIALDVSRAMNTTCAVTWFDPRDGSSKAGGIREIHNGLMTFEPPEGDPARDLVLMLDRSA